MASQLQSLFLHVVHLYVIHLTDKGIIMLSPIQSGNQWYSNYSTYNDNNKKNVKDQGLGDDAGPWTPTVSADAGDSSLAESIASYNAPPTPSAGLDSAQVMLDLANQCQAQLEASQSQLASMQNAVNSGGKVRQGDIDALTSNFYAIRHNAQSVQYECSREELFMASFAGGLGSDATAGTIDQARVTGGEVFNGASEALEQLHQLSEQNNVVA